jgi:hypothetical protein
MNIICRMGLHSWRTPAEKAHALHLYGECARCGARSVVLSHAGYQPIDYGWVAGGEPARMPAVVQMTRA